MSLDPDPVSDTDPAPAPLSLERTAMVENARSYVGCSAAPASRERYCDLLCASPEDYNDPEARSEAAVQSGCARAFMGLLEQEGVQHPLLANRYVTGHAVSDCIQIAKDLGAWRAPDHSIQPGDGVVIKVPSGEHVLTAEAWKAHNVLVSVDGGQRDGQRFEAILRRERSYVVGLHGASLDNCPILGVIDFDALAKHEGFLPLAPTD